MGALIADRTAMAEHVAGLMLEVKAIHFDATKPFIFTSGWASPVYVDCRRLISFPRLRRRLMDIAVDLIEEEIGAESLDAVAGGETAGIPFAAWIAERLMLPMQYVRKQAKGFGRNAQIEGEIKDGQRVLLVEDLATDGRSKLRFCKAIRDAGATVDDAFVVFYYGIFPDAPRFLAEAGIRLHALATWWDALSVAKSRAYFDAGTLGEVESFLNAPAAWSAAHGGVASFGERTG